MIHFDGTLATMYQGFCLAFGAAFGWTLGCGVIALVTGLLRRDPPKP